MRARAPASSANLGPGFDTLGLALDRHVEVEIVPSDRLSVVTEGEGAGMSDDASHLAARVAIDVTGHDRLAVTVRSDIPVARGLGSSAALAAAAAAAAGATDPLAVATRVDGHPDNAAASVLGGLVAATLVRGSVRTARLALDPALVFVAIVPDRPLSTAKARQVLPSQVSRADACFNLGRLALLLAGLADRTVLNREATEDRLHQDYRSPLFPEASRLLAALTAGGALASCWSGAGPTLLGICDVADGDRVRGAATAALEETGVRGQAMVLRPDLHGLVLDDGDGRWRRFSPGDHPGPSRPAGPGGAASAVASPPSPAGPPARTPPAERPGEPGSPVGMAPGPGGPFDFESGR